VGKRGIYVMDRGYLNYNRFLEMNRQKVYFVSRLKENTEYKRVEKKTDRIVSILSYYIEM
jgi:hypothetical protein